MSSLPLHSEAAQHRFETDMTSKIVDIGEKTSYVDLGFLPRTSGRIASGEPVDEIFVQVLDYFAGLLRCASSFVHVLGASDQPVVRASLHPDQKMLEQSIRTVGSELLAFLREHQVPVAISEADSSFRILSGWDCQRRAESSVAVPLISNKQFVGVLHLQHCGQPRLYGIHEITLLSTVGFLFGAEIGRTKLVNENLELSERLATRKLVERAKGILQRELGLDEEESYRALQSHSRRKRKPLKEVAEAILLTEKLKRNHQSEAQPPVE